MPTSEQHDEALADLVAATCRFRASTAHCVPTATSIARRPRPPCGQWPRQWRAFLPWYSSVHRGAGYKSRRSTAAYEESRNRRPRVRQPPRDRRGESCAATPPRPSTHLAYRLAFEPGDVVATTWSSTTPTCCRGRGSHGAASSSARRRHVRTRGGRRGARRKAEAKAAHHHRCVQREPAGCRDRSDLRRGARSGIPVALDAAQLAPHRAIPTAPDYVAFSGHKLYAPYGARRAHRPPPRRSRRASRSSPVVARSTSSTSTR